MKFAALPRIQRQRLQTSTSQSTKSLRLPREMHPFGQEPLQIPHACQRFCNPRFEPQKAVRDPGVLTISTSKSLSRAGVVQILATAISKSAPRLTVFNDFDFPIVLARRRGANFGDFNFQVLRRCQFLTILTSKSLSRAGVVQILTTSTSKSAPIMPFFYDFDFQIALARRRGANFAASSAADPPRPPVLRS